ncbi:MAG: hypothetical protein ACXVRJ_08675 [Gaiellaceae bacterium]
MEPQDHEIDKEPRLILGVPGVGAGLLGRASVEWLLQGAVGLEETPQLRAELAHWLEHPLPGKFFGTMSVREDELGAFRTLIQRAGWTYGAPEDVQAMQLAVARSSVG